MLTKIFFFLLFFLNSFILLQAQSFVQMGSTIVAEAARDRFGEGVSMSGNRVAISALNNQGSGIEAGHVRIYEWDGNDWVQLGNDIDAEAAGDRLWAISMDGDRLAVGAFWNDGNGNKSGHVRVFEWDGLVWTQLGSDIDGEHAGDASGNRVVLKRGTVVIAAYHNNDNGYYSGQVQVFDWDGTNWIQKGSDINGEAAGDFAGNIDFDGKRLAIGAHYNDGNGLDAGHVRVFEWGGLDWVQVGNDIEGEAAYDLFGQNLSIHGNRLIASSLYHHTSLAFEAGHVRVFEWDSVNWVQLGADIEGDVSRGRFGKHVELQGNTVAISGSTANYDGEISFYVWNGSAWIFQTSLTAPVASSSFGNRFSWEQDYLAVGEPFYANLTGQARMYKICNENTPVITQNNNTLAISGSATNTYQWFSCSATGLSPITGANGSSYAVTSNGDYAVVTTNGFCSDTSTCHNVTMMHTATLWNAPLFKAYPNPTQGVVTIDLAEAYEAVTLKLYTLEGKLLHQVQHQQWQQGSVSLEGVPQGLYILNIQAGERSPQYIRLHKQ